MGVPTEIDSDLFVPFRNIVMREFCPVRGPIGELPNLKVACKKMRNPLETPPPPPSDLPFEPLTKQQEEADSNQMMAVILNLDKFKAARAAEKNSAAKSAKSSTSTKTTSSPTNVNSSSISIEHAVKTYGKNSLAAYSARAHAIDSLSERS